MGKQRKIQQSSWDTVDKRKMTVQVNRKEEKCYEICARNKCVRSLDTVCEPLALVHHCAVYCRQRGLTVLAYVPNDVQSAATRLLTLEKTLAIHLLSWRRREKHVKRKSEGLDWRQHNRNVFSGVKHLTTMRNFPECVLNYIKVVRWVSNIWWAEVIALYLSCLGVPR